MFTYSNKTSYLETILERFEKDEKFQNIGQVIQYNEQFGQLYAVVVITRMLQAFPKRCVDLFIKNNFIAQFINLIENNNFSQYEMQLIDLTFQHLTQESIELSGQTKASLLENVQR